MFREEEKYGLLMALTSALCMKPFVSLPMVAILVTEVHTVLIDVETDFRLTRTCQIRNDVVL